MPLSPADFYAYSQATGAPVADTPEKRAQQATEVLAFQENRLKAPKEGPGLLDILGAGALGVGGAIAASYAGPRLARAFRNRGAAQAATQTVVEDVTPQAAQNVRRAAAAYTQPRPSTEPAPSRVPTAGPVARETPLLSGRGKPNLGVQMVNIQDLISSVPTAQAEQGPRLLPGGRTQIQPYPTAAAQTGTPYSLREIGELGLSHMEVAPELDVADRLLRDYELGKQSRQASRIKAAQQDREMQLRGIGARIIDQLKGESLVDQQQSQLAQHVDQSLNAVNAAEDQMTGRMKHALQQNPHLDMSQVEVLEDMAEHSYRQGMEQDEPINAAAMQMTGHVPNDQAEDPVRFAQRALQQQRDQLAAQGMSPGRVEKALGSAYVANAPYVAGQEGYMQRQGKKAMELYLQTGDPNVLKTFETGQLPETLNVQSFKSEGLAGEQPTSTFLKDVTLPEAVQGAQQRHEERVGRHIEKLQSIENEIVPQIEHLETKQYNDYVHAQNRIPEIDEHLNMIEAGLVQGHGRGSGELLGMRGALTAERNQLSQLTGEHHQDEINALHYRLGRARDVYGDLIEGEQVKIPQTLVDWKGELPGAQGAAVDPDTGKITIPGRLRTVSNVEVDPETGQRPIDTATGGGIRGIGGRPGRQLGQGSSMGIYGAQTSEWAPGALTHEGEYTEEAMLRPTAGQNKSYSTRPSTTPEIAQQSFNLSEQVRKAKDPQAFLAKIMKDQGISAIGPSSPLRYK
jgi:hypothetical protein